ncbi:MAG TPA: homoserine O-acetyltransferase [Helicobacteraceae bacterium]|nr:homoserine O-acetyltransferase [Helicobacteraceae bacterium]
MVVKTKKAHFTNPLYLESGRILEPYDIMYETYGTLSEKKDNVIIVLHALTGSHHAAGKYEDDAKSGWWDGLIGSKKAIDTDRYYVICANVIGSCFGSTGPTTANYPSTDPFRFKFPVITVKDMVKAQKLLLDKLGIYEAEALIGGSMGGMQALQFSILYPHFAKKVVALATTYATQPWTIAFNKVAQEAIRSDPIFDNGNYPMNAKKQTFNGLSIARMAGHISFLSPESMQRKFGREYRLTDGLYELFGKYQVESYLEYNGKNFSQWFDPITYLYLIKAINIFDLSRGYDSLELALEQIESRVTLISFSNDMLFQAKEMRYLHEALQHNSEANSRYIEIESDYGHDAFLVEIEKFEHHIIEVLQSE